MSDVPATSVSIPRFGVKHIMLWTLCSGLQLVAARWILTEELKTHVPSEQIKQLAKRADPYMAVGAIVVGFVLAAMGTLVASRMKGRKPLLSAPGHWLVFNLVLILVFDMAVRAVLLRYTRPPLSMQQYLLHGYILSLGHVLTAVSYLWAAIVQKSRTWRALLGAAAAIELIYCLLMWFSMYPMVLNVLLPALSLLTFILSLLYVAQLVLEARRGLRRDWVHQSGVYGLFVFALMGSLNYFVFR